MEHGPVWTRIGAATGDDALDVWQHCAFAKWLDTHERPGDAEQEAEDQLLFEMEWDLREEAESLEWGLGKSPIATEPDQQ